MKKKGLWSVMCVVAAVIVCVLVGGNTAFAAGEISVSLVADKETASPGETIKYTYTIANNWVDNVTGISLNDSKFGSITLPANELIPGENITITKEYMVVVADLPGPITTTGTVNVYNDAGELMAATSNTVSVRLEVNKNLLTKADILKLSGVPGKGIDKAPGLLKFFNPNSKALENAGKKIKNREMIKESIRQKNNDD